MQWLGHKVDQLRLEKTHKHEITAPFKTLILSNAIQILQVCCSLLFTLTKVVFTDLADTFVPSDLEGKYKAIKKAKTWRRH